MKYRPTLLLLVIQIVIGSALFSHASEAYIPEAIPCTNYADLPDDAIPIEYIAPGLPNVVITSGSSTVANYYTVAGPADPGGQYPPNANGAVSASYIMTMDTQQTTVTDRTGTNVYVNQTTLIEDHLTG